MSSTSVVQSMLWPDLFLMYTWSISVACGVVGKRTSCLKLKLDIRLNMAGFSRCKISSLKSPSITQVVAHFVICVNSLVSNVNNVARATLGDLYTTAICKYSPLGSCMVAETASMPLVANLCTLHGSPVSPSSAQ